MSTDRPRVGYMSRVFPVLSETFVLREALELEKLGIDVIPFSVHRPDPEQVHPEGRELLARVQVIADPRTPLFWFAHPWMLARHPVRYLKTLWRCVIAAPGSLRGTLRALAQFAAAPRGAVLLRRARVQHLHAHFANIPTGIAMMSTAIAGIGFSCTIHSYDLFVDTLLLPLKLRSAAFVATVSHFNEPYIEDTYGDPRNAPVHVVRCGIDPQRFQPRAERRRGTPPLILSIGRLVELKGFHTLIRACAILRQAGEELRCVIVGEGPDRDRLAALIAELDLGEVVTLAGKKMQDEVRTLFAEADLFVLASCVREYQDNLPVVLIESLAMQVPAISTRITAIPELIIDGETGLLVEPEDDRALAAAMRRLLADEDLSRRLAEAGRRRVIEQFTTRANAHIMRDLFLRALQRGGPSA
jgi:glycosyltransferase involved in cell wall biosynthesis